MVDERLLKPELIEKVFGTNITEVVKNPNLIKEIYLSLVNSLADTSLYDGSVELKADIIENYILSLTDKESLTLDEKEAYLHFKEFYKLLYKSYGEMLIDRKINKFYYKMFFNGDTLVFKDLENNISLKIEEYFEVFNMGADISTLDLNKLMIYLTSKIGDVHPVIVGMQEALLKRILKGDKDYGIYAQRFLFKYLNYQECKTRNIPLAPFYISEFNLQNGEKLNDYIGGKSYFSLGLISLNKNILNRPGDEFCPNYGVSRDIKNLHTFFHELTHYEDAFIVDKNKVFNKNTFDTLRNRLMRSYLSTDDYNIYKVNYNFDENERRANVSAWKSVSKTLTKFSPERKRKELACDLNSVVTLYEEIVGIKVDQTGKKIPSAIFNVEKLNEIIKSNPSILDIISQFKLFYKNDGSPRNLYELIVVYNSLKASGNVFGGIKIEEEVFDDYIAYYINTGNFYDFDYQKQTLQIQVSWFNLLTKHIYGVIGEINKIISIDGKLTPNEAISNQHVNNYLKASLSKIEALKNYVINNYFNIRLLYFRCRIKDANIKLLHPKYIESKYQEVLAMVKEYQKKNGEVEYGL